MNFTSPFSTRRVRDIAPDTRPPTVFEQVGGWSDAAPTHLLPEDAPSEREQRSSGATALSALYRDRATEAQAKMDAKLAGVQRGHDFSKGLYFREDAS